MHATQARTTTHQDWRGNVILLHTKNLNLPKKQQGLESSNEVLHSTAMLNVHLYSMFSSLAKVCCVTHSYDSLEEVRLSNGLQVSWCSRV